MKLDGGSAVVDGDYIDPGEQGIMYGYGGQHVALDGDTFGKVLTDARNEVLSGACDGWRRLTSTFSEQTDLLNPNDGGVYDGKDDLDVQAGGCCARGADRRCSGRDRGGDSWYFFAVSNTQWSRLSTYRQSPLERIQQRTVEQIADL